MSYRLVPCFVLATTLWACGGSGEDATETDDPQQETQDPVVDDTTPDDSDSDSDSDTDTDTDVALDSADTDDDTLTDTDDDTDTDSSGGETGDSGTPPAPTVDCNALLATPSSVAVTANAKGYHDVAFDSAGLAYGEFGGDIVKVDYAGTLNVFKPNIGGAEGMDFLPNGNLVVARSTNNTIVQIAPNGAQSTLASNVDGYGVTIGPDGQVYVGTSDEVLRIDPTTGAVTVIVPASLNLGARAVDWSPDLSKMYFSTLFNNGNVYEVPVDTNLDPTGPPVLLASGVGGSWHDGMGVDVCGNVYVPVFTTRTMYRITPAGVVSTLIDASGSNSNYYGHNIQWGNGIGGWEEANIYFPQPYNSDTVGEAVIGVPHRSNTTWTVLNGP